MAETRKLNVIVANAIGEKKTISIPNPLSAASLSLSAVTDAFQEFFDSGTLLTTSGSDIPYSAVYQAKIVVTTETTLS